MTKVHLTYIRSQKCSPIWSDYFYHSSHVRYTMILPIDGVASISYYMEETLDHANNCVWLHFLPATLCQETTIWILHIAFNDGGNRTRAACSASECAIHCAIASRKPIWSEICLGAQKQQLTSLSKIGCGFIYENVFYEIQIQSRDASWNPHPDADRHPIETSSISNGQINWNRCQQSTFHPIRPQYPSPNIEVTCFACLPKFVGSSL